MSELLILDAVYFVDTKAGVVIYIFPAKAQLGDFVQARIEPCLEATEYFKNICHPPDERRSLRVSKVGLKRIRDGYIYFRGSRRKDLVAVDADMVILDELDTIQESVPEAPMWADERLDHSKWKWWRYAGIPTYEDVGIDEAWKRGTMRRWHIKCERCGFWQYPTWDGNILLTGEESQETIDGKFVCQKCRRPTNRLVAGTWVPEYPDREIESYHITKLMSSRVELRTLAQHSIDSRPGAQQRFICSDLGETYKPSGDMVTPEMIKAAIGKYHMASSGKTHVMGIDPGGLYHWSTSEIAGDRKKTVALGAAKSWEELEAVVRRYDPDIIAIDQQYETKRCQAFAAKWPNRTYLVTTKLRQPLAVKLPKEKKAVPADRKGLWFVESNRYMLYDGVIDMFDSTKSLVSLPIEVAEMTGPGHDPMYDFFKQMQGVRRIRVTDMQTNETVMDFKKTSIAHWFDTFALEELARVVRGKRSTLRMGAQVLGGKRKMRAG